jgi:hypothetical protein
MILITVAPVGHRGSWSVSIEGRIICPSVRWPLVAAAKALLAEEPCPGDRDRHEAQGLDHRRHARQDRHLSALTREAATPEGPSPPQTGSQGGDHDEGGVTDEGLS